MKKTLLVVLALLISFLFAFSAYAEKVTTIPEEWGLLFEYEDVRNAAKEACIIFNGAGTWDSAKIQTAGIVILEQVDSDKTVDLSLYVSVSVFSIDNNQKPKLVSSASYPARLVFERVEAGYRLVFYDRPEDGESYAESIQRIFPSELSASLIAGKWEAAPNEAAADAIRDAEAYIAFTQNDGSQGVWKEFLTTGSNKNARKAALGTLSGHFPGYIGKAVWFEYGRLYSLQIEGEQTYSGTITCEVLDAQGKRVEYCRFKVDNKKVKVLDGKKPPYYE